MRFFRPESSVSVGLNDLGEEVFGGDRPGPVRRRTPEELGIPRVIADRQPGRLMPYAPNADWKTRMASAAKEGLKKSKQTQRVGFRTNAVQPERKTQMPPETQKRSVLTKRYGMPAVTVVSMEDCPPNRFQSAGRNRRAALRAAS
jgi:hypothetical protein